MTIQPKSPILKGFIFLALAAAPFAASAQSYREERREERDYRHIETLVQELADEAGRSADIADREGLRSSNHDAERVRRFADVAQKIARDMPEIERRGDTKNAIDHLLADGDEAREALKRTEFSPELSREWHAALDTMGKLRIEEGRI